MDHWRLPGRIRSLPSPSLWDIFHLFLPMTLKQRQKSAPPSSLQLSKVFSKLISNKFNSSLALNLSSGSWSAYRAHRVANSALEQNLTLTHPCSHSLIPQTLTKGPPSASPEWRPQGDAQGLLWSGVMGLQLSKAAGGDGGGVQEMPAWTKRQWQGWGRVGRASSSSGPNLTRALSWKHRFGGPCRVKVLAMGDITKGDSTQLRGEI